MTKLNFILDVDGVMNTGQFLYSEDGKAFKVFGPHDNDGLKLLKDKVEIKFITADKRGYPITCKRIVEDMGFELELISEQERFGYIEQNYDLNKLIYMGDGYHDVKILKVCKFGIAPISARKEARDAADFVTESKAGDGAVLDACLEILNRFFHGETENE
ncbi:MAG: HAD hydrolase family protein [Planctomycetes bacterium]|nr:HAD hydrolase family protein [Planctomycetota bacterium]